MTFPALSKGALLEIYKGNDVDKPICQVLGIKKLASGDRYRVLVSDSAYISSFTMLATQLNHIIEEGTLEDFSIIQIGRYVLSQANNAGKPRRIMIILEVTQKAKGSEVGGKIGNPVPVEKYMSPENGGEETQAASSAANNAAQKRPAAPMQVPEKKRLNSTINSGADIVTTPIAALSPYQQRWVIKARVSNKSAVRSWSNARGEGKLFNIDLIDESGEIRCTGFREAVDKFFDMIEMGKIYYISRCQLKPVNRAFNSLNNEYEMTMTNDTEIIPCDDASDDIPQISYDFKAISMIENLEKGSMIDVLGIVKDVGAVATIRARETAKEFTKREISLVDRTNTMITLTIWGQQAEEFEAAGNPVLAVKGARVGEFNGGKNIGTISSSVLQLDPDHPDAHRLRGWWNSGGSNEAIRSLSKGIDSITMAGNWMTLKDAIAMGQTLTDQAEFYRCKATVSFLRSENAIYRACPSDQCNKKVVDHEGSFRCEKCDREYPNFKYRILAQVNIADYTGSIWATAFSGEAEQMLGMTAQELGELAEQDREAYLTKCASTAFTSYLFKIRMKMENYQDDSRMKSIIQMVSPVNWEVYNGHLLAQLKESCNFNRVGGN